MTVPAAVKEMGRIEMLKGADSEYILVYAVTTSRMTIRKAFDLTAENIYRQIRELRADLLRIETEALENRHQPGQKGINKK